MMKKTLLFLLLGLILAACAMPVETELPATAVPESDTPTPGFPPLVETAATVDAEEAVEAPMAGCTLQTILEPPSATEVSRFPAVSPEEWQAGPEDAATTIVEYGDFQ